MCRERGPTNHRRDQGEIAPIADRNGRSGPQRHHRIKGHPLGQFGAKTGANPAVSSPCGRYFKNLAPHARLGPPVAALLHFFCTAFFPIEFTRTVFKKQVPGGHAVRAFAAGRCRLSLVAGRGASPSVAQTAADNAAVTGLETVIVTARKRAEDAQTVPISITALSQADLDKLQSRPPGLPPVAPSVNVQPSTFRQDTLNITIRGQRNFDSPIGRRQSWPVVRYRRGGLSGRRLLCPRHRPDRRAVRHEQRGHPEGAARHAGRPQLHRRRDPASDATNPPTISAAMSRRPAAITTNMACRARSIFPSPTIGVPRRALRHRARRAISPIISPIRSAALSNTSPPWAPRNWPAASRPNGSRTTVSACWCAPIFPTEHDTGSTYHDLGYFVGTTLATGNKPSICNIPGGLRGFTDFLGHPVAPYYTTVNATSVGRRQHLAGGL